MTDLAYMVREDWAQQGTAMVSSSARIREWLGDGPVVFAVTDKRKFNGAHSADLEAAEYIVGRARHHVVDIADLTRLADDDRLVNVAVVVLHPFDQRDCEALSEMIGSEAASRVFALIWSPRDIIRAWLDGHGAVDLHTGTPCPAPDPLQVAAAKLMVAEQYNGLSSGRGKDAVVQLLRAFTGSGYPLDGDAWLRAFFAAGGAFRHAESLVKFVKEMKAGTKHRVKPRFRDDILDILRERVTGAGRSPGQDTSQTCSQQRRLAIAADLPI
ncbi:hypothetical protein [Micromonospora sp. NPDC126480]|uniref:hypothetical protein n=1 Tax=Micromonospora sp. NPDC126480 TaxID=3155312 RepID=UPI003333CF3E